MTTPRELISKVRRPFNPEPDAPTPALPTPVVRDTIRRVTYNPDGTAEIYEFTPGKGESTRTVSADEVPQHSNPTPEANALAFAAQQEAK